MAEGGSYIDSDKFKCPICLDLMRIPVTIPCGHSYCMMCIGRCWDKGGNVGVSVCPQCRQKFVPRPKLAKNAVLAEVVEKLREERKSRLEAEGSTSTLDVYCDVCTGAKATATRSCLVCLASYCEQHIQPHFESIAFKTHRLLSAPARLQDRICHQHNKLLEFYCQTDKLCVCYVCMFGEHRGHNVVSAETERATKKIQKQLAAAQQSSQQGIRTKEKELKELKQAVGNYKNPAKATVGESCLIRDSLIKAVRQWQSDLERLIKAEESKAVSNAQGILAHQEQVLSELRKRDAEIQQLSQSDDHIHFLKSFEALCEAVPVSRPIPEGPAAFTISYVRDSLEKFCREELTTFSKRAKEIEGLIFTPKTRTDFLRYSCHLTLDPNTANGYLELNNEERSATCDASCFCPVEEKWNRMPRPYPPHADRFDFQHQVLCKEPLFGGRFYWEVEGTPLYGIMAACYGSIPRKENSFLDDLATSRKSWCADCSRLFPFVARNGASMVEKCHMPERAVPESEDPKKKTTKVGFFLDYSAGLLSLYVVDKETMSHMYTFRTLFTEPLYVALKPSPTCTLKLSSLEPLSTFSKQTEDAGV
ncbi:E3 ubiquitin-protein ligase TRIM47-like [Hoplias malabaricus]|uniref:E3 ubiquitin-protein ligase TRIM47-like n=1 Tax=Hoplias malabaricus TaxID=27720 RepID=UPI00346183AE